MNVQTAKARGPETAASQMTEEIIEHVTALMMLCGGIESISTTKYVCGTGDHLHVSISHFKGVPTEIYNQGIVIKDALAQILSIANVMRVVTSPSKTDLNELRDGWQRAVSEARAANAGSAQDFEVVDAEGSAEG